MFVPPGRAVLGLPMTLALSLGCCEEDQLPEEQPEPGQGPWGRAGEL